MMTGHVVELETVVLAPRGIYKERPSAVLSEYRSHIVPSTRIGERPFAKYHPDGVGSHQSVVIVRSHHLPYGSTLQLQCHALAAGRGAQFPLERLVDEPPPPDRKSVV